MPCKLIVTFDPLLTRIKGSRTKAVRMKSRNRYIFKIEDQIYELDRKQKSKTETFRWSYCNVYNANNYTKIYRITRKLVFTHADVVNFAWRVAFFFNIGIEWCWRYWTPRSATDEEIFGWRFTSRVFIFLFELILKRVCRTAMSLFGSPKPLLQC